MQSLQQLKHTSQLSRKKGKHDNIVLLAKNNLNAIKVLISQALSDSYISNGEFILLNYVIREYHEMKEEIKNPNRIVKYTI